ncbi:MAG: hypothetical protein Q7V57_11240 [Actinomycetota bacterium]|nr:hypothetical protein [Actinomycetota bacterium]
MIPRTIGTWTARALEAVAATAKAGQFVSWPASKGEAVGMVMSVHRTKVVPGVPHQQEASVEAPAARVQLYARVGGAWEATTAYLGIPVGKLTPVDPSPPVAATVAATEAVVAGSFNAIRSAVEEAIRERIEELAGVRPWVYIYDLGASWAVYEIEGTIGCSEMYLVDYMFDEASGVAVLVSDPVEVRPVTLYQPVVEQQGTESVVREDGGFRLLAAAGTGSDGGRIFRVLMIRYGDSKNGRRYSEAVMRAAAPLYEGAKAYDHHRTDAEMATSTIAGLVGTFRNVAATGVGLEADLCLLPSAVHTAEALDMALANQAAGLDPLIGLSQDVYARWKSTSANGRVLQEATEIISVNSIDVVANPAAGGHATRMVAAMAPNPTTTTTSKKESTTVNLKQLLALLRAAESAAQRSALLQEHAHVIEAAGLTNDEALRASEAGPAPAPTTTPAGPVMLARESLTSAPVIAAAIAAAKVDVSRHVEAIKAELPEQFTEADLVTTVARFERAVEASGLTPTVPHVEVTADATDKYQEAFDLMLDPRRPGGFRSLKEAYVKHGELTGSGRQASSMFDSDFNQRLFRECTTVARGNERFMFDSDRATESIETATFGEIFGDSITRRMIAEYAQPSLATWRKIVSSVFTLTDFRTQRITSLGGYGVLPAVAQGAPYQALTSPSDEESTYAASKRGGTDDWTLEAARNDDLRALQRIPQKLGLAAAQTLYRFVWDMVATNPTLTRDSVALFHASHANTTSTALSATALATSRKKMRTQAAYGDTSDILSLVPKYLLVPSTLEELAWQLCTSAVALPSGAPVGAASNTPNIHQGMEPVVVDYWDASSTTQWYLGADPALCPTIEIGFLDGREEPALFMQADDTQGATFNADKVVLKVRHIYGGAPIEYRGFQRGNS